MGVTKGLAGEAWPALALRVSTARRSRGVRSRPAPVTSRGFGNVGRLAHHSLCRSRRPGLAAHSRLAGPGRRPG